MWDGSFKSKKQVSLRGKSSRQADRDAFKQKIKQDREKRARQRELTNAAIVLQSKRRTTLNLRNTRHNFRKFWDSQWNNLNNITKFVGGEFVPAPSKVAEFVRILLFFYDDSEVEDQTRFLSTLQMLKVSMETPDPRQNYIGYGKDDDVTYNAIILQLCRFLSIGFSLLTKLPPDSTLPQLLCDFVDTSISVSTSGTFSPTVPSKTNKEMDIGLSLCIKSPLSSIHPCGVGVLDTFSVLISKDSKPKKQLLAWMVKFVSNYLVKYHTKMMKPLIQSVLFVPFATKHAHVKSMFRVVSKMNPTIFEYFLDSCVPVVESATISKEQTVLLLSNIVELTATTQFLNIIVSKKEILDHFTCTLFKLVENSPDDSFGMPKSTKFNYIWPIQPPTQTIVGCDQSIINCNLNLTKPTFVRQLLQAGIQYAALDAKQGQAMGIDILKNIALLFTSIYVRWNDVKTNTATTTQNVFQNSSPGKSITYALAFRTEQTALPFLEWLWDMIFVLSEKEGWLVKPNVLVKKEAYGLIYLACATANVLVPALDDEELFKANKFLPKAKLIKVTHFLRDMLHVNIWVASSVGPMKSLSNQQTLMCAIELYGQLYERYSRHQYMPAEEWLFPNIVAEEFGLQNLGSSFFVANSGVRETVAMEVESDDEMSSDDDSARVVSERPIGQNAGVMLDGTSERGKLILRLLSQCVPFEFRVSIFAKLLDESTPDIRSYGRNVFTVKRSTLYEDAFEQLANLEPEIIRDRVQIKFVNEQGLDEAGIDGGGVFKEFIVEFSKQAFDIANGLWKVTDQNKLYPNPSSRLVAEHHLAHFRFIGRMLGKAVYEGVLIEPEFAEFFLNMLLQHENRIHDLQSLDAAVYRNLMSVKSLDDPTSLDLNFTVSDGAEYGAQKDVELVPNGRDIIVSKENVIYYINAVAFYRLNSQIRSQCEAFREGFSELIDSKWIQMFQPRELQLVIGGSDFGYETEDLRKNVAYTGGYHPSQPYIQMVWDVITEFSSEQRAQLLNFVTSCPRPPLQGFASLKPPFTISQVHASDRLPTASTCVNLLKLPKYGSKEELKEKLIFSISSGAGFELS